MSYFVFQKMGKMEQNLPSAAVMIGALRVKIPYGFMVVNSSSFFFLFSTKYCNVKPLHVSFGQSILLHFSYMYIMYTHCITIFAYCRANQE